VRYKAEHVLLDQDMVAVAVVDTGADLPAAIQKVTP
jgi:hypothetical protein